MRRDIVSTMVHIILTILLLLSRIEGFYTLEEQEQHCNWITPLVDKNCNLICENGTVEQFQYSIDFKLKERNICSILGMSLTLHMESNSDFLWITKNTFIVELNLHLKDNSVISDGVFSDTSFSVLKYISIDNFVKDVILNNTFSGLINVQQIQLTNATIDILNLEILPSSVKVLKIFQTVSDSSSCIRINGVVMSNQHLELEELKMTYRLCYNTITSSMLSGLHHLKILDFSHSNIQIIEENAFNEIYDTIEFINLEGNMLKNLPIQNNVVMHRPFTIELKSNPLHCDCKLETLKLLILRQIILTNTSLICCTPEIFEDEDIMQVDFCLSDFTKSDDEFECYDNLEQVMEIADFNDYVDIKNITVNQFNQVTVEVETNVSNNYALIWFHENDKIIIENPNQVNCESSETGLFQIDNLRQNTTYTMCLISTYEITVSPINCFPFDMRFFMKIDASNYDEENIWLTVDDKLKCISIVVSVFVLNITIGLLISYMLIRKNPTWLRGNKRVVRVSRNSSTSSQVMIMPSEWKENGQADSRASFHENNLNPNPVIGKSGHNSNRSSSSDNNAPFVISDRTSKIELENKYYIHYLQGKEPPPLPPKDNIPVYSIANCMKKMNNVDNYYSEVNKK